MGWGTQNTQGTSKGQKKCMKKEGGRARRLTWKESLYYILLVTSQK